MSLFSCGRQPGLCSVRIAALLAHLLELLSEALPFQLCKLVSIEILGYVNAKVTNGEQLGSTDTVIQPDKQYQDVNY